MFSFFRSVRWRFGLTTLFSVTAIIAAVSAFYGTRIRALEQQEEAFRQIASKGGWVYVWKDGTTIYFEEPQGMCVFGLIRVVEPDAKSDRFTDQDLNLLDRVLNLQYINLHNSSVTPQAVQMFELTNTDCHVSMDPF
jgi:hypothetical protein